MLPVGRYVSTTEPPKFVTCDYPSAVVAPFISGPRSLRTNPQPQRPSLHDEPSHLQKTNLLRLAQHMNKQTQKPTSPHTKTDNGPNLAKQI